MSDAYWGALADEFRRYTLECARAADAPDGVDRALAGVRRQWATTVCRVGERAFEEAAAGLGDDAVSLRQRVQGEAFCRALVQKRRKEYAPDV